MKKARPLASVSANIMEIGHGECLRHYTALENTEDGSRSQEAREALHERCAQRNEAEADDEQRQVVLGSNFLKQDVRWDWESVSSVIWSCDGNTCLRRTCRRCRRWR